MKQLPIRTYTPAPLLADPPTLIRDIIRDMWQGRELAWRLFIRDCSAQYRQTFLGYLWALLPPLFTSMTFIFLNRQGIIKIDETNIPYPAFAMIGTLLWQAFVEAMQSPPQTLTNAKSMLTKINFPREAILLGGLYMVTFNLLIRLLLIAGVLLWWNITPSITLLMFPIAMGVIILTGFVVGLALAPVASLYGDISRAIPVIAPFWMLLTPVVYPARKEGLAALLTQYNPLSPLITTARECLTGQSLTMLPNFTIVALLALIAAFMGLIVFRLSMPHLIARMGG